MMKCEFEKLIGKEVSCEDYGIIDYVYTWHPVISNTNGKQQMADIYKIGGMLLIKDMHASATKEDKYQAEIRDLRKQRLELDGRIRQKEAEHANWIGR